MVETRDPYAIECGARLRRTRAALNPRFRVRTRFADHTGIDANNLAKWEYGDALVPPYYVQRLRDLFGVNHDWIYGGDASSLRHDLAVKLLGPEEE